MAKTKGKRTTAADLFSDRPLKVGDRVLLGGTHASYPGHWYHGTILWVGAEEILLERSTFNGDTYLQLDTIYAIRAVGATAELLKIQDEARKATKELTNAIQEAESALGAARDALYNKLEDYSMDYSKAGMKIIPWDREANDACDAEHRAISEKLDTEQSAMADT